MNKVAKRAWAVCILAAMLVGGMGFFVVEFTVRADKWVVTAGSPHVYNGDNINTGAVTDRNGILF